MARKWRSFQHLLLVLNPGKFQASQERVCDSSLYVCASVCVSSIEEDGLDISGGFWRSIVWRGIWKIRNFLTTKIIYDPALDLKAMQPCIPYCICEQFNIKSWFIRTSEHSPFPSPDFTVKRCFAFSMWLSTPSQHTATYLGKFKESPFIVPNSNNIQTSKLLIYI